MGLPGTDNQKSKIQKKIRVLFFEFFRRLKSVLDSLHFPLLKTLKIISYILKYCLNFALAWAKKLFLIC